MGYAASFCPSGNQPEIYIYIYIYIYIERERERETGRQTDRQSDRETERHGTQALREQRCFNQHGVGMCTVLQGSYSQQR